MTIPWLLALMTLPATAMPGREDITSSEVASAIGAAGLRVLPMQVTLLSDVYAKTNVPTLKVESMEPWGIHRLRVRLDCARQQECLPFYVAVGLIRTQDVRTVTQTFEHASPRPERDTQARAQAVMRAGTAAVLLLEGTHIRIQLAVTCLEGGNVGQAIRVVDKGRHTYLAQICSDGFLRGKL
ncbi:MAG: hypothetical protein WB439_07615 [Acidobacteriaceae bacterium]